MLSNTGFYKKNSPALRNSGKGPDHLLRLGRRPARIDLVYSRTAQQVGDVPVPYPGLGGIVDENMRIEIVVLHKEFQPGIGVERLRDGAVSWIPF